MRELPRHGVVAEGLRDVQFGHELTCTIDQRRYDVLISFDWVTNVWWEVMFAPTLSWIARLFGGDEEDEMRRLGLGIHRSLMALPDIIEIRWYSHLRIPPDGPSTIMP